MQLFVVGHGPGLAFTTLRRGSNPCAVLCANPSPPQRCADVVRGGRGKPWQRRPRFPLRVRAI